MHDLHSTRIRVANAPCSWGVLEFGLGEGASYRTVLQEIASSGYEGTELGDWGFMPTEPSALADALGAHHLALVGAFVPAALWRRDTHDDARRSALRVAHLMAGAAGGASSPPPCVVLSDDNGTVPARAGRAGRIGPDDGLAPEAWDAFAEGAAALATAVRDETGLRTVFHPHCGGFVEAPWELAALMDRTDAALLGLCLDTGHVTFGGGDPVQVAQAYAARTWHLHLKDCDVTVAARSRDESWDYLTAVRQGVFCELGQGQVDFAGVLAALADARFEGWAVVEQDVLPGLGTPVDSARRNRAFLRGLGL
ncbi:MAG: sugar phosphate isomerase/epimerase [Vicinamibacterales bacterium]